MNNAKLKQHVKAIDKEVNYIIANAHVIIEDNDWRESSAKIVSIVSDTSSFLRSFMFTAISECNVSPACMFYGDVNQIIYQESSSAMGNDSGDVSYLPARRLANQIEKIKTKVIDDTGSKPTDEAIDASIAIIVLEHFIKQTKAVIKNSYQAKSQNLDKPTTDDIVRTVTGYIEEQPLNLISIDK